MLAARGASSTRRSGRSGGSTVALARVRLALDATPLIGPGTGVAAFARGLLGALVERGADITAYALSWRGRGALASEVPPRTSVVSRPMVAGPLLRAWRRLPGPPIEWWTGEVDVVHGTNFVVPPSRRAARVVTVHDLTAVRHPELCTPVTLQYPALVRRAVATGAFVHTPSDAVAAEVVELLGVAPERVCAVHNGVDPVDSGDARRGRALAGAERYVVAIGTVEPRKGLPTLVQAFDEVAADRPELHLVIAGPDGWGTPALEQAIAGATAQDRIRRLGYVDANERADLLSGAALLAYPSVYEGFGLPPLEAMSAGLPVVASDAGSLPEVLEGAAELVPARSVDAFAEALARVLDDDRLAATLVERGRQRAARFTWTACADGLMALYRDAAMAVS